MLPFAMYPLFTVLLTTALTYCVCTLCILTCVYGTDLRIGSIVVKELADFERWRRPVKLWASQHMNGPWLYIAFFSCKKSIEMNLSRKRATWAKFDSGKARDVFWACWSTNRVISCRIYCAHLQNASVDQHRLHGCHHHFSAHHCSSNHPRRTRWPSFQTLLLVSTWDKFLTILNYRSVQYLKYTEVARCCVHCLQYI